MDRGAWWAMVHRVAKSQTQLSTHAPVLFRAPCEGLPAPQLATVKPQLEILEITWVHLSLCISPHEYHTAPTLIAI